MTNAGGSIDRRSGRHFYDIHQLLGNSRVLDLLADREETNQVLRSIEEINRAFFGGAEVDVRPPSGFALCPAFDPTSEVSATFRAAYESTMPELYFGRTPLPAWETICARVAEQQQLL